MRPSTIWALAAVAIALLLAAGAEPGAEPDHTPMTVVWVGGILGYLVLRVLERREEPPPADDDEEGFR